MAVDPGYVAEVVDDVVRAVSGSCDISPQELIKGRNHECCRMRRLVFLLLNRRYHFHVEVVAEAFRKERTGVAESIDLATRSIIRASSGIGTKDDLELAETARKSDLALSGPGGR